MSQNIQDKCRGSLVGGAVGDALGYEVEFMSNAAIRKRFGTCGITDYVTDINGVAEFSDDTQMSLFTAEGLLNAVAAGKRSEKEILPYIKDAYLCWYATQTRPMLPIAGSRLSEIPGLWSERAPGTTCMSALHTLSMPDAGPVINYSKGCGGVMRVAPIGIFSAAHPGLLNFGQAGRLAGDAAEITHKHPASTYSSMAMAMIVAWCIREDTVDRDEFRSIVLDRVFDLLAQWFPGDSHLARLTELIQKALTLAESDRSDIDAIRSLGEGWVGDEALAIALFSVMRHVDDFERCVCCAVNHDGDSDSTGAVAGNIIGVIAGHKAIPQKYLTDLELHHLILTIADDLAAPQPE